MSESTSRWGADALAVIDLGSNSFRLEIARLRGNDYRSLAYWKEPIRLGAGLDAGGFLTETAIERALTCLRRFGAELQGFSPERVRAVATQTLREARNRNAFLVRGGEALGHAIEVIAGREEARLIYAGVSHLQPSDETPARHRHRRAQHRDDPRAGPATAARREFCHRQRRPFGALLCFGRADRVGLS
jgi:exopolyphosphatase/pppGpp-phosphohydrolase